jgi:tRNA-dihydrouridine synthase
MLKAMPPGIVKELARRRFEEIERYKAGKKVQSKDQVSVWRSNIFSATRSFLATGAWRPAPFADIIAAALRHLELRAADIGEHSACLEMRKQFCAYTKQGGGHPGVPGLKALRNALVHAETIADYRAIVQTV